MTEEKPADHELSHIDPQGLLRLMSLVAVISIIVIITVASFGIYEVFQRHIIRGAEDDAVSLSELILAHERKNLSGPAQKDALSITPQNISRLDRRFRSFLKPFNIVKIKIYDRERRIIYSTDPSIIGHIDDTNPRLDNALAGHNDSKLENKESVIDLAEEQQIDVDVVETYVPIRSAQGDVIGCFEIYADVTRYRGEINGGVITSALLLTLILAAVCGASYLVVRKGTNQLRLAQDRLRHLATIDPLTGAFNRGEILSRARKETSRLRRSGEQTPSRSIALVMLDLDRFKNINDTLGHIAGDLVLRQVTRRIKLELRDYDLFGRYGGEEFLAILPATNLSSAVSVAERMRRAVGDTPLDIEGQSLQVTVSLGVAVISGEALDLTGALKEADEALYRAKNAGRNRVCSEKA
ncbi:GGDEF domain-containing protein [Trichloromonas sp.]|uniref:GGDEF domain-containing protein n=1 Tax=Trichloromonas sp. TaxID=3069249 RepID=UPI003D815731